MKERDDERFAREAYERHLRDRFSVQDIQWARGANPPDYCLNADGFKFAVEVTTITPQYQRESRRPLPDIGLSKMLSCLTHRVQQRAVEKKILDAHYSFHLDGPHSTFDKCRDEIAETLLRVIEDSNSSNGISMQVVDTIGEYTLSIAKLSERSPGISYGYSYGAGGLTDNDLVEEVDSLVRDAIADKREKLSAVSLPKVLLLIDNYYWLDPCYFPRCPVASTRDGSFHSIYIITLNGDANVFWPPLAKTI